MLEKNLNVWLTTPQKKRYTQKYPEIPRNTRKYPRVKKIPENTRSYISTLLPDPLPGIFSNTRPDPILKNPTCWALTVSCHYNHMIVSFNITEFILRSWN